MTAANSLFFRHLPLKLDLRCLRTQSVHACALNGLSLTPGVMHLRQFHYHYMGLCDLKCKNKCSDIMLSNHSHTQKSCLRSSNKANSSIMFHNPHSIFCQSQRCFFTKVLNKKKTKTSANPNAVGRNNHDGKSLVDRFVYVKTLKDFYKDIPSGIVMDTAYADSRPNEDVDISCPVLLGLHDTPGSHRDLVPLMEFFAKLGCRVVCPTLPGHGQTKGVMKGHDDIFCQSTLERANFVNDFLGNVDIERVDVVVGVGASSYTAMALCMLQPQVFKSTALISPWPVSKLRFPVDPKQLERILSAWDVQYIRPALRLLLAGFKLGNASTVQDKITLAYLLQRIDFGEVFGQTLALSMKKVPYIMAYGGQDSEIDPSLYDEIMDSLEISSNAVTKFNGVLNNTSIPGALMFPDSDYHILAQQRSILCVYVLKLLQCLHPHIKI